MTITCSGTGVAAGGLVGRQPPPPASRAALRDDNGGIAIINTSNRSMIDEQSRDAVVNVVAQCRARSRGGGLLADQRQSMYLVVMYAPTKRRRSLETRTRDTCVSYQCTTGGPVSGDGGLEPPSSVV